MNNWVPANISMPEKDLLIPPTLKKKIRHDFLLLVTLMKLALTCTKRPEPSTICSSGNSYWVMCFHET